MTFGTLIFSINQYNFSIFVAVVLFQQQLTHTYNTPLIDPERDILAKQYRKSPDNSTPDR